MYDYSHLPAGETWSLSWASGPEVTSKRDSLSVESPPSMTTRLCALRRDPNLEELTAGRTFSFRADSVCCWEHQLYSPRDVGSNPDSSTYRQGQVIAFLCLDFLHVRQKMSTCLPSALIAVEFSVILCRGISIWLFMFFSVVMPTCLPTDILIILWSTACFWFSLVW